MTENCAVMFSEQIDEKGTTSGIFKIPTDPYTEALLNSIPRPDPGQRKKEERHSFANLVLLLVKKNQKGSTTFSSVQDTLRPAIQNFTD